MDQIDNILDYYFNKINIIPDDTRKVDQVFARSAMMVAMREHMTLQQVGKIFNKNHATIHHSVKNHEENLEKSKKYKSYYEKAQNILMKHPDLAIIRDKTLMSQFTRQKKLIMELSDDNKVLKNRVLELEQQVSNLDPDGNRI